MKIVISSGHGKYVRGASGKPCGTWGLDEVDEARHVVEVVADLLIERGVEVTTFHDDSSRDVNTNLDTIVNFHNAQGAHDYDLSIHLNAFECSNQGRGCEVLYVTQQGLAAELSAAMAQALDLPDRGAKYNGNLAFLNGTREKACLLELCFVDDGVDCTRYRERFHDLCDAIADIFKADEEGEAPQFPERPPRPPTERPQDDALFTAKGPCSWFGGPTDMGVGPAEGLALYEDIMDRPVLFLPYVPENTTGLARRLNSEATHFVAARWDYSITSKEMLRTGIALVRANGIELEAYPADWGPAASTGRACDLSICLMKDLKLQTDQVCEVIFPAPLSQGDT